MEKNVWQKMYQGKKCCDQIYMAGPREAIQQGLSSPHTDLLHDLTNWISHKNNYVSRDNNVNYETNKKLFFCLDDEAKNVRPLLRETAIYFYLGAAAG